MRIEHIKAGMVLSADLLDEHGHLLLEKGIALTQTYLARMQALGFHDLPIADAYAESLKDVYAVSQQLKEELALCFQALFHLKSKELVASKLRSVYLRQLNATVDSVITEIESKLGNIVNVQVRMPSAGEVEHAVNVCLLSVITGLYLKLPRPVLQQLALGALLHDIGKSAMPELSELAADPGYHCLAGQSLLSQSGMNAVIARIAAEHHEHYDGAGYPGGLEANEIHPLSRIVAVANFFENSVAQSDRRNTPRQDIMEYMLASGNRQFDLNVLRAFCHTAYVFPVGSLVKLSTGQLAYVVENQPPYPLRPIVRVWHSETYEDINLVMKPQVIIDQLVQE